MQNFVYQSSPSRIVFGVGSIAKVAQEIEGLGCRRALLLSTPFQTSDVEALAETLGDMSAGVFTGAAMHTPVHITKSAMAAYEASGADCVLAYGGGSTIGLGKAIAWRNDAPQLVVATTYAGSEATDILGQTESNQKTTVRDPKIRPETVIYDPELTVGLPVPMSVSSGMNAMAHAVEAVYAPDANPVTSLTAIEGVRAIKEALPLIVEDPADLKARSDALYGSWLCGVVLGSVAMSLHHKLCHTLGGGFDMPHAETHAALLPHTAAYNSEAAGETLKPVADLFGGDLGGGLHDFASQIGAPLTLRDLGLRQGDINRAADMAVERPYANPRPVTRDGIHALLTRAFQGARATGA